jgi:phage shock protein A
LFSLEAVEQLAAEKEKQLLETIGQQKQQIAAARKEEEQLRQLLAESSCQQKNSGRVGSGSWEEEVDSLRTVLRMRGQDLEQLRAANNTLLIEMER